MAVRTSGSAVPMFLLSSLAVVGAAAALATCSGRAGGHKSAGPQAAADLNSGELVADTIVVDFQDGTTKATYDELEKGWGIDLEFNSVEGTQDGITIGRVDPARREALLEKIRQDPRVERAEALVRVHADFVPNDPQFKAQWNLQLIGMPDAWEVSAGEGVTVAVIDTGIAYEDAGEFRTVPDLKGARFVQGYDFVNDDEHANDDHGHGTHVAGTIAQVTHNGEGVAGIAYKATLMPIKVLDANGSGTSADVADGIRFAADHGAKVMNLSLGGGARSQVMADAVAYARKKGVLVVCAAGNGGRGVVEFPAAYPGALAVSAVGPTGELASYSSWGKELDIAAPGGDKRLRGREEDGILQNTIAPGNPGRSVYAWFNGTSMATPHVAGVAALLFAAGASTPEEVEQALFAGADHARSGEWSERLGHGVLNAKGALQALGATPGGSGWWKRLASLLLAIALWLVTRMSLPRMFRAGFKPGAGFIGALLLSAMGLFFLPWLGLGSVPGLSALSKPATEWGNWLLGSGNWLFSSAALPILLAMIGLRRGMARGALAGFSIGLAAVLLVKAFTGAGVAWLSSSVLAAIFLALNAFMALLMARAVMHSAGRGER